MNGAMVESRGRIAEAGPVLRGANGSPLINLPDDWEGPIAQRFVIPGDAPPTPEALRDFCRARLAEFKVPRRFTIARDLPRGPTGKLLKRALRDWKPA